MKIILSNIIEINEPTKEVIELAKKKLTMSNPEFEKKRRMGFYCYGMNKEVKLYNLYDGKLYVPYGFFNDLYNIHPINSDYQDYTVVKKVNLTHNLKLRDYQKPAITAVKEHFNGLLLAGCGLGKTMMGLGCFAELKQKCLWLTHSIDLLEQAKNRCEDTINCKTSVITDGKCDVSGDIVFATIQTVIKYIENETLKQDEFGMVIGDEIHRCTANPNSFQTFRKCIEYFSARYKVGLTATKFRSDGLEGAINYIVGGDIYQIIQDENDYVCVYNNEEILRFSTSAFQVPAIIKVFETDYDVSDKPVFSSNGGTLQYASLISDIAMDEERNNILIRTLKSIDGSTIVLSERVEQLKYLCSQVENGIQIDGETPKKERRQALNDVRNGKIKYLFASYNLCREGLDCPILANLVMASPVKNFATVVQSIGRIQRPYPGKKIAQVYDFVDPVGMLRRFYGTRRSTYVKNNWKVDNIYLTKKIR